MPYFKNDKINLLFIHIPKTGGESVEYYFRDLYNIPLNNKALWGFVPEDIQIDNNIDIKSSLQHLTYQSILKYQTFLNIDAQNLKLLTIVRNPYNRIVSDLFWFKLIVITNTKDEVFSVIQKYLSSREFDNHNMPQHLFLTDTNNKLIKNVTIMRTETLNDYMIKFGYTDFNIKTNCNPHTISCWDYLNNQSIQLINSFYKKDFKMFNYDIVKGF
jgi:hypothetical protein